MFTDNVKAATVASVAARLRWAVERSGQIQSIRQFQQRLRERGVPGTGYSNVYRYVTDDAASPPLEFLQNAGAVLEVRPAWLAFGDGDPSLRDATIDSKIDSGLSASFPQYARAAESEKAIVRRLVTDVIGYRHGFALAADSWPDDHIRDAAEAIGAAFQGDFTACFMDVPDAAPWEDYFSLRASAMRIMMFRGAGS